MRYKSLKNIGWNKGWGAGVHSSCAKTIEECSKWRIHQTRGTMRKTKHPCRERHCQLCVRRQRCNNSQQHINYFSATNETTFSKSPKPCREQYQDSRAIVAIGDFTNDYIFLEASLLWCVYEDEFYCRRSSLYYPTSESLFGGKVGNCIASTYISVFWSLTFPTLIYIFFNYAL